MPNMFRNFTYPGSDFHEMNLQWLFDSMGNPGLALNVSGNALRLVNSNGDVLSSVIVSYAEKALTDKNGNDISTYILSVAGVGDTIVFTKGDGTNVSLTVPYATKAKLDINGHDIEDYIYNVQVAGNKLRVTHGDGTISEITVPYALQATADEEGKDITTYAASLSAEGDAVVLRDSKGRLLSSVTVPFATKALQDVDGDAIKANYASALQTGTTTVILKAKDGSVLSTITVPYATDAGHADNADLATVATDCTNAVETVAISGDTIVFTTYGGQTFNITAPYAVKALKDDLGNQIKSTYVANVSQDAGSGVLSFYDAMGVEICHLTPVAGVAIKDDYNNNLADYIKSIIVSQNADYVTVTHGTGVTDTLTIHYSETAWKDTNDNVIKNTYIKYMECVEDVDDGHYKIVCYDGDNPMAELFRFEVTAYSAQTDINGKDLTTYVADVGYNAGQEIEVKDGNGNVLNTLRNAIDDLSDVEINNLLATGDLLGYDGTDWTNVTFEVALDDLTDVTIDANTLADGDVLTYDANADEWVNKQGAKDHYADYIIGYYAVYPNSTVVFSAEDVSVDHDRFKFGMIPTIEYSEYDSQYLTIVDAYLEVHHYGEASYYLNNTKVVGEAVGWGSLIDKFLHADELYEAGTADELRGTVYFNYLTDDKFLQVDYVYDCATKKFTTFTGTLVSSGAGGGSGLPSNPHCIVGDFANGGGSFVYTAGNAASIVAGAKYGQKLAITLNNTDILYCAGVTIKDETTSTYIFDKDAVQVIEEAGAGTLTNPTSIKALFYTKYNNDFVVLEVEIVLAGGTIVSNGGNVA